MYSVHIDKKNNQLLLAFEDQVDAQQTEEMHAEIQEALALLTKGFDVITDLSALDSMDINVRDSIDKSMNLFSQHGIARTIRIIPDPRKDIGFNILGLFHYPSNVIMHTFKSKKKQKST